jgi:hypothetical protein
VIKHELRVYYTASKTSQLDHCIGEIIFQNNFVVAEKIKVKVYVNEGKSLSTFKKLINNSRGKYKRNECLINVCKSDTDLS